MAYDLQEQEQLDELKAFWQRWGGTIIASIVAAILAFVAVRAWNWYQVREGQKASAQLTAFEQTLSGKDEGRIDAAARQLRDEVGGTLQATIGMLKLAHQQYGSGRKDAAMESLRWVVNSGNGREYQLIARLRLAGMELDAGRNDEALKLLDGGDAAKAGTEMEGSFADRRGDVFVAQDKLDQAKAEYDKALRLLGRSEIAGLVQVKREALGK